MELPPLLRRAADRALSGVSRGELAATAATLSQRYLQEQSEGRAYVASSQDALAYLAVRLPAAYAAVRASVAAITDARPDFEPKTALDVGAGPGTALCAAVECWPTLAKARLVEASPIFRAFGEQLAAEMQQPHITWHTCDVAVDEIDDEPRDLVTLAYVLNELAAAHRQRLWRLTADILVIVEPGTPAGWQRILAARHQLIEAGGHVIAPCPHANACPLEPPDWCHFARRVARSRLHRQAKSADVPWEDEKFIYVAVSRKPATAGGARVIGRPRKASGRVTLKLCRTDGSAGDQLFSRRDGEMFKHASRRDWGSSL